MKFTLDRENTCQVLQSDTTQSSLFLHWQTVISELVLSNVPLNRTKECWLIPWQLTLEFTDLQGRLSNFLKSKKRSRRHSRGSFPWRRLAKYRTQQESRALTYNLSTFLLRLACALITEMFWWLCADNSCLLNRRKERDACHLLRIMHHPHFFVRMPWHHSHDNTCVSYTPERHWGHRFIRTWFLKRFPTQMCISICQMCHP